MRQKDDEKEMMVSELTVIIKDEEKTLKTKYLIYETYEISLENPTIKDCVEKTLENFDGNPSNITVKIEMDMT